MSRCVLRQGEILKYRFLGVLSTHGFHKKSLRHLNVKRTFEFFVLPAQKFALTSEEQCVWKSSSIFCK